METKYMGDLSNIFLEKFQEYKNKYDFDIKGDLNSQKNNSESNIITITTGHLLIRNLISEDIRLLHKKLWGDPDVMRLYGEGKPRSFEDVASRMEFFLKLWKSKNPFSCFVVRDYKDRLVGAVLFTDYKFTYNDNSYPNSSYLSFITAKEFQGKGLSKEYISAVVFGLSKFLIENDINLSDNRKFDSILATCGLKNIKSMRVLESLGFELLDKREKFNNQRYFYSLPLASKDRLKKGI